MSGDFLYLLIDIFMALFGAYIMGQYSYMVKTRKIRGNLLLPKSMDVKLCKDTEGYIRYVGIKQLLFGIGAMVCGITNLAVPDTTVSQFVPLVFVILCLWYVYILNRAFQKFW